MCQSRGAEADPPDVTSDETQRMPSWVWKLPAGVSFGMFIFCIIGPLLWPITFLSFSKLVLDVYVLYLVFYISMVICGLQRIHVSERERLPIREMQSVFSYAFIIPNYKEEITVLECTIANLASHPYAKRYLSDTGSRPAYNHSSFNSPLPDHRLLHCDPMW